MTFTVQDSRGGRSPQQSYTLQFEVVPTSHASGFQPSASQKLEIFFNHDTANHGSPKRVVGNDRPGDRARTSHYSQWILQGIVLHPMHWHSV